MRSPLPLILALALALAAPLAAGGNAQSAPDRAAPAASANPDPASSPHPAQSPKAPTIPVPRADAATPGHAAAEATAEGCAAAVATRVQSYYDNVVDLEADFEQRTKSAAFGSGAGFDAPAAGRVFFAKPGKMRWTYQTPQPSEVISDGSTLWVYDPTAQEVQVLEVGEAFLSAAAIQFMLGSGRLLDTFDATARGCGLPSVTLHLLPKEAATYEFLELDVRVETGAIEVTRVADLLGNRTEVRFQNVKTNQSPEPSRFQFETPAGVRELRLPSR